MEAAQRGFSSTALVQSAREQTRLLLGRHLSDKIPATCWELGKDVTPRRPSSGIRRSEFFERLRIERGYAGIAGRSATWVRISCPFWVKHGEY
jgi:hypothetical protein